MIIKNSYVYRFAKQCREYTPAECDAYIHQVKKVHETLGISGPNDAVLEIAGQLFAHVMPVIDAIEAGEADVAVFERHSLPASFAMQPDEYLSGLESVNFKIRMKLEDPDESLAIIAGHDAEGRAI